MSRDKRFKTIIRFQSVVVVVNHCFKSLFGTKALSSGRIVPIVTIGRITPIWVTLFIPRERPNVKQAIAGYLRPPRRVGLRRKLYAGKLDVQNRQVDSPPVVDLHRQII